MRGVAQATPYIPMVAAQREGSNAYAVLPSAYHSTITNILIANKNGAESPLISRDPPRRLKILYTFS